MCFSQETIVGTRRGRAHSHQDNHKKIYSFHLIPQIFICPFCKIYINTAVNKSVSCCNVLCFVCTSPVLWAAFQLVRGKDLVCLDAKHRCPNCGANVGTYTAC